MISRRLFFFKTVFVLTFATFLLSVVGTSSFAADDQQLIYYMVEPGDYLWLIGWKFDTGVDSIARENNLSTNEIFPGQVLKIPLSAAPVRKAPGFVNYNVKQGDSLYIISRKFGVSVSEIQNANNLSGYDIYTGMQLTVPLPRQQRYVVQAGDTLFLIAQRFKCDTEALKIINRINSDNLYVKQVLFVPSGTGTEIQGGRWGDIPEGVILHNVKGGENLWSIAKAYNTTIPAIMSTNHLHSEIVQVNQPLFIPVNSNKSVDIPYPYAERKDGFGEYLDWMYVSWVLDTHNTAVINDLETGMTFKARRLGGSNHADMEPLTALDTEKLKSIYGGNWSWNRRAVLVYVDDKVIAGSMAGMPHDVQTIYNNGFPGHFDLHFLNSRTHYNNSIDVKHQAMVQKAAGI